VHKRVLRVLNALLGCVTHVYSKVKEEVIVMLMELAALRRPIVDAVANENAPHEPNHVSEGSNVHTQEQDVVETASDQFLHDLIVVFVDVFAQKWVSKSGLKPHVEYIFEHGHDLFGVHVGEQLAETCTFDEHRNSQSRVNKFKHLIERQPDDHVLFEGALVNIPPPYFLEIHDVFCVAVIFESKQKLHYNVEKHHKFSNENIKPNGIVPLVRNTSKRSAEGINDRSREAKKHDNKCPILVKIILRINNEGFLCPCLLFDWYFSRIRILFFTA
jgi:hypothetical protein